MPCSDDYIDFVCHQLDGVGSIRPRKMFGDWVIYVDDRPVILACDELCYVKKHPLLLDLMADAECGFPFPGAKEHFILDIDHASSARRIVRLLADNTPLPKKKKSKV